jgi:Ca2+-dependent lipid-binding protein
MPILMLMLKYFKLLKDFVFCSDLELKPQGILKVTVMKANDLKNMEMIGKSDPYVVVHIRPLFKVKTKVIDNNLNPIWNEEFDLIAEDKETQSLTVEV